MLEINKLKKVNLIKKRFEREIAINLQLVMSKCKDQFSRSYRSSVYTKISIN